MPIVSRSFIMGLPRANPWVPCMFPYVFSSSLCRDLPALCASHAVSRVFLRSTLAFLVLWAIHSLVHYPASSRQVTHTLAVNFPMPLPICYSVVLLMYCVNNSALMWPASRIFTLRLFRCPMGHVIRWSVPKPYSRASPLGRFNRGISPAFPVHSPWVFPCVFPVRFLCVSSYISRSVRLWVP